MAAKRLNKRSTGKSLAVPDESVKLTRLGGVNVAVSLELGRSEITLDEARQLGEKTILAVDKLADEPVEVYVNGGSDILVAVSTTACQTTACQTIQTGCVS